MKMLGEIMLNLKKHRNKTISEIYNNDKQYLYWILKKFNNDDFYYIKINDFLSLKK